MQQGILFKGYFSKTAIEVPFTKAIPRDYYGSMGVPITALDLLDDQYKIIDLKRLTINGKLLYARIIIRKKLPPEIEEYMDNENPIIQIDDDLIIPLIQET